MGGASVPGLHIMTMMCWLGTLSGGGGGIPCHVIFLLCGSVGLHGHWPSLRTQELFLVWCKAVGRKINISNSEAVVLCCKNELFSLGRVTVAGLSKVVLLWTKTKTRARRQGSECHLQSEAVDRETSHPVSKANHILWELCCLKCPLNWSGNQSWCLHLQVF